MAASCYVLLIKNITLVNYIDILQGENLQLQLTFQPIQRSTCLYIDFLICDDKQMVIICKILVKILLTYLAFFSKIQ